MPVPMFTNLKVLYLAKAFLGSFCSQWKDLVISSIFSCMCVLETQNKINNIEPLKKV